MILCQSTSKVRHTNEIDLFATIIHQLDIYEECIEGKTKALQKIATRSNINANDRNRTLCRL